MAISGRAWVDPKRSSNVKGNRANVNIINEDAPGSTIVQVGFPMNTTGNETQNQVNDMIKAKTKEILQAAVGLQQSSSIRTGCDCALIRAFGWISTAATCCGASPFRTQSVAASLKRKSAGSWVTPVLTRRRGDHLETWHV
jgi:hypothetical protein